MPSSPTIERMAHLSLVREVEEFLYRESALLDAREYEPWLDLFSDDVFYWVPMRTNRSFKDREHDITDENDIAWFQDDKITLTKRVKQIMTGVHWAEEPLSRVTHVVSNVRIPVEASEVAEGESIVATCHFVLHRSRLETVTDLLIGRREDTLRRLGSSFQISRRKIIIDQSTLLIKSLTFFL